MTKHCDFNGVVIVSNVLGSQIQPTAADTQFCSASYRRQTECDGWSLEGKLVPTVMGIIYYNVWGAGCDKKTI